MPKVSVIVPIYKVERYLNDGIESILAQTYKDYEIILVDDGSPDGCGKICDDYAERYDNIRVVHKENGGLSSARNAGLDVAEGEYIYFFDPDDKISPVLLEHCVNRLEEDGSDAVRFGFSEITENGKRESLVISFPNEVINCDNGESKLKFIVKRIFGDVRWSACTCLYSGNVIRTHNLRFADNRKIFAEDMYFNCLFIFYAQRISLLNERLYYYIRRDDSIMGAVGNKLKLNEMNCLSKTLYSFVENDYLRDNYDVIHHLIVMNQIERLPRVKKARDVSQYDMHLDSVEDKEFFCGYMKRYHLRHCRENLKTKSFYNSWYDNMIDRYLYSRNMLVFFGGFFVWKLMYIPFHIKKALRKKKK